MSFILKAMPLHFLTLKAITVQFDQSEKKLLASRYTKGERGPAAMGVKLYYTTVTGSRTVSQMGAFQ